MAVNGWLLFSSNDQSGQWLRNKVDCCGCSPRTRLIIMLPPVILHSPSTRDNGGTNVWGIKVQIPPGPRSDKGDGMRGHVGFAHDILEDAFVIGTEFIVGCGMSTHGNLSSLASSTIIGISVFQGRR